MTAWPRVTPEDADRMMREGAFCYLDVRSVQEFELGHPLGAFNLPWDDNPQFVEQAHTAFDVDQPLIVGCQVGQRSSLATAALLAAGFTRVVEQHAGFGGLRDTFGKLVQAGWERAGLPTSTIAEPGRSYRELCTERADNGSDAG
jgi:rhodanese-related sulfurtransferase